MYLHCDKVSLLRLKYQRNVSTFPQSFWITPRLIVIFKLVDRKASTAIYMMFC